MADAVYRINRTPKDAPTGISSTNFPWLEITESPWKMHLRIINTSTATFRQDQIHTIQRTVSKEKLCSMVSNPEYVVRAAKPEIIRVEGVDMIYNGHHRLAALWIYGEMDVECLLLEAEKTTPPARKSISY